MRGPLFTENFAVGRPAKSHNDLPVRLSHDGRECRVILRIFIDDHIRYLANAGVLAKA